MLLKRKFNEILSGIYYNQKEVASKYISINEEIPIPINEVASVTIKEEASVTIKEEAVTIPINEEISIPINEVASVTIKEEEPVTIKEIMNHHNDINYLICTTIMRDTILNPIHLSTIQIDWSKINDNYIKELIYDREKQLALSNQCYKKYCELTTNTTYDPIYFKPLFWMRYILRIVNTYIKTDTKKSYINIRHSCCGSKCPLVENFSTIMLNELYNK